MSTPIPSLGNKTPEQLKVAELREELRKRGASVKGLKKDLVERLDGVLRQEGAEATDPSKESGQDEVSDGHEEEVVNVPAYPQSSEGPPEGEVAGVVLKPPLEMAGLEEVEALPLVEQLKSGTLTVSLTEEADFPSEDMPVKADEGLPDVLTDLRLAPQGTVVTTGPVSDATRESLPEFHVQPFSKPSDGEAERENSGAAPAVSHEGKPFEGGLESGTFAEEGPQFELKQETRDDALAAGKVVDDEGETGPDNGMEAAAETDRVVQAEQLEPFLYRGPTSSTDAVIIEASEADNVPVENAVAAEGLHRDREMEEVEESVVQDAGAESVEAQQGETVTVDTVSVVTETTTVTTTETIVVEADISTAEAEAGGLLPDAGTISIEGVDKEEPQRRVKDEERMEDEPQDAKLKDSKPMVIDSDSLTGLKRKDGAFLGDESRQQEPAKRQRRWNSEKGAGIVVEVKSAPQMITADTVKEMIAPESRESVQAAAVARSPTAAATPTPKVSASAKLEKPAPSRPALSRADIGVNGEVEKKRLVPPSLGNPTLSLKIDRFVRPFTIKAVRELLEQTGEVKEMWMDQIKTHCYVTYSSMEEATATRNALYNLQWPVAGGKLLIAEFVEPEEVKLRVEGLTDKPAATPVTTPRGLANNSAQAASSAIAPPATSGATTLIPPAPSHSSAPRERPAVPTKKEPEPPIPTLDDLFKKTRAKPQIYFLPLTEEQVSTKQRNKQPVRKEPVKA